MLAVVESMRDWRHYLEGSRHPIQIFSDHKNLKPFMSTKVPNRRQARWAELLAGYDFVLIHVPGVKNPADGPLSHPDYSQDVPVPTGSLLPLRALRFLPPALCPTSPICHYRTAWILSLFSLIE